ncbi:transposase [Streptomyces sp. CA-106110]|uniref:transposase n=1 Tax=Streptomyces sp. CA-106110 TaxID=3240044 RepID=UPI003D8E3860
MLDAIRYRVDNGIKWRAMPGDFPPWNRVYAFSADGATSACSESSTTGCLERPARRWAATRYRRPV